MEELGVVHKFEEDLIYIYIYIQGIDELLELICSISTTRYWLVCIIVLVQAQAAAFVNHNCTSAHTYRSSQNNTRQYDLIFFFCARERIKLRN